MEHTRREGDHPFDRLVGAIGLAARQLHEVHRRLEGVLLRRLRGRLPLVLPRLPRVCCPRTRAREGMHFMFQRAEEKAGKLLIVEAVHACIPSLGRTGVTRGVDKRIPSARPHTRQSASVRAAAWRYGVPLAARGRTVLAVGTPGHILIIVGKGRRLPWLLLPARVPVRHVH